MNPACTNCGIELEAEGLCPACAYLASKHTRPMRKRQLCGYEFAELVNRRWQMFFNRGELKGEIE